MSKGTASDYISIQEGQFTASYEHVRECRMLLDANNSNSCTHEVRSACNIPTSITSSAIKSLYTAAVIAY